MAILLFSLGIFLFAVNDALGKWLVTSYPVGELILLRTVGAVLFLAPMLMRQPSALRLPPSLGLQILRVMIMALDSFAFYFATRTLPLADVMTFYLAAPLFVTMLAIVVLGERIGVWRWLAVGIGFVGVVIALQPSAQAMSPAALIALGGSLMFATSVIITRRLRQTHWLTLVSWQFMGAGLVGALTSRFEWVTPPATDIALMALVGLVSMLCFICINKALTLAQASLLAPLHYMSIVWAIVMGWLVWGDIPTPPMTAGIVLIVASGGLIWFRERSASPESISVQQRPVHAESAE